MHLESFVCLSLPITWLLNVSIVHPTLHDDASRFFCVMTVKRGYKNILDHHVPWQIALLWQPHVQTKSYVCGLQALLRLLSHYSISHYQPTLVMISHYHQN